MRADRPSTTAIWVSAWRALASLADPPIIRDEIAERVLPEPYAAIVRAARSLPSASARLLAIIDAVSLGRSRHLTLRTRAIDDATSEAVARGATQLVIVGAGLDARAYRLPALRGVVVFEVDHPSTQAWKRARAAGLPAIAREVRHVVVDFERDGLAERLAAAGHDPGAPTVFIWEGVTMYLSGDAIDVTLSALAARAAPGSTLVATYFEPRPGPLARALALLLRGVSEPMRSSFAPAEFAAKLAAHGFDVVEDAGDPEWSRRYLALENPWSLERLAIARRRAG